MKSKQPGSFDSGVTIILYSIAGITLVPIIFYSIVIYKFITFDETPHEYHSSPNTAPGKKKEEFKKLTGLELNAQVDDFAYSVTWHPHKLGPSESEYMLALKTKPKYVKEWLANDTKNDDDYLREYLRKIPTHFIPWPHMSQPESYDNVVVPNNVAGCNGAVAFRKEGILLIKGIH